MLTLYTDGGISTKNNVGGYGAILLDNSGKVITTLSGVVTHQPTNNIMELAGVIFGFEYILAHPELGKDVTVISDSEYVVLGGSERVEKWQFRNWKTTAGPVKNKVLWEAILVYKKLLNVSWKWVRGHNGDEYNEKVDKLAVGAYKQHLERNI